MATQKEIAKKAGVSQCTVSYVLSGTGDNTISSETADRILALAGEMNYQKRFVPARKNGQALKNIGYLVPDLPVGAFLDDPYYARFISGLTNSSCKNNCNIVMYNKYSQVIQAILDRMIDGLIIEAHITDSQVDFLKSRIPTVLLNRKAKGVSVDSVMPDNVGGIRKVISRLFSMGHDNIGFFGTKPLYLHSEERYEGYLEAMQEYGLNIVSRNVCFFTAKRQDEREVEEYAYELLQSLKNMSKKPSAIVASGDNIALPLIKTAHRYGFKIPEEFSLTGFDNRSPCIYSHPSLTSIEQPMEEMAKKALLLLSERIENPDKPVENVVFDVELIERESICEKKKLDSYV